MAKKESTYNVKYDVLQSLLDKQMITASSMSKMIGRNVNYISQMKKQRKPMPKSLLRTIAKKLNVSVVDLISEEKYIKPEIIMEEVDHDLLQARIRELNFEVTDIAREVTVPKTAIGNVIRLID